MSHYFKYPRTPHLPWSQSVNFDDLIGFGTTQFRDKEVVISEKMDGENTSLYRDKMHARSLDSRHHASRNWVKAWHANFSRDIPEGWRICGENMYAQHSVAYDNLKSYFYGFSIWDENNTCLSWDATLEWFSLLGILSPPILFRGVWNEKEVRKLTIDPDKMEGYVVRLADAFSFEDFSHSVAKWVRKNHVQTNEHWMHIEIIPNRLAKKEGGNEDE